MSGTLDWIEEKIKCPYCKNVININFCIDFNPYLNPMISEGIAGGHIHCPKCGHIIHDDDIRSEYIGEKV